MYTTLLVALFMIARSSGDDSTAAECLAQHPLDSSHPTVFITALSSLSYSVIKENSARISFVFSGPRSGHPVWIYTDNTWDEKHGRSKLKRSDFSFTACLIDIFRAESWLGPVSETGGAIDQYYDFSGYYEPCDQPLRMKT